MTKLQYLQEQAARAERLARSILDTVTVERLQAFAAECRAKAETLNECEQKAAQPGSWLHRRDGGAVIADAIPH
jgi:hypothetical protein